MTWKHKTPAVCLAAFVLFAASYSGAQMPATTPTFEVSTVKLSKPDNPNSEINLNGGAYTFSAINMPLDGIIRFAYNLNDGSDDQIVGGPAWLRTSRFDITTKSDDATIAQLSRMNDNDRTAATRLMVQALLADRFHFKVHHETRSLPVIVLTLADPSATSDTKLKKVPDPAASQPNPNQWYGLHNNGEGHVEVRGESMKLFADFLGNLPEIDGRMVLDQTGLTGTYDFDLNWTPQQLAQSAADNGSSDPSGATLFAALTEQLGLKLKSTKAPVDVIVIDHIDPPTPN